MVQDFIEDAPQGPNQLSQARIDSLRESLRKGIEAKLVCLGAPDVVDLLRIIELAEGPYLVEVKDSYTFTAKSAERLVAAFKEARQGRPVITQGLRITRALSQCRECGHVEEPITGQASKPFDFINQDEEE